MNYGVNHRSTCFTFQSLITHFVCVTHRSEKVLYNTSVSSTQRICIYDSFQLEILSLFALAGKIHAFTLEVIASSSTVAAVGLTGFPAETHLRPLNGKILRCGEGLGKRKGRLICRSTGMIQGCIPLPCLLFQVDFKISIRNDCFRDEKVEESVLHGSSHQLSGYVITARAFFLMYLLSVTFKWG